MNQVQPDQIAAALRSVLISPNEADSNLEPANVVDGLYAIARAIQNLADVIEGVDQAARQSGNDHE